MLWQIAISKYVTIFLEAMKDLAFFAFLERFALETFEFFNFGDFSFLVSTPVIALEATCLVLGIVIMLLFCLLGKLSEKVRNLYYKIKQLIIWNALIRYVFHSSLKLQITAATIIQLAMDTDTAPE